MQVGWERCTRASDTRLNRTVAIKVLPAHLASDVERRQRFEREARIISRLDHAHVCALYDVGHESGREFLVMQYLDGETLADRLKRGALPVDGALEHAAEIAEALDAAHRHGIVHRDLKPANVMLTKSGVKVLDFGLARLSRDASAADASGRAAPAAAPYERHERKVMPSPSRARYWEPCLTWRPNKSRACLRMYARTSLRSARSSSRW